MNKSIKMRGLMTMALAGGVIGLLQDAAAQNQMTPLQKRLVSGFASYELDLHQAGLKTNAANLASANASSFVALRSSDPQAYFPRPDGKCSEMLGNNVKVNQNCLNLTDPNLQGRGQANNETTIAQDPNNPQHMVAGNNDYRRGDGTCGVHISLDGGETWQDGTLPNGFVRGTSFGAVAREYWQASGDPSVAWDTKGNAYFNCQVFQRGAGGVTNNPDQSSGIYLFRSTGNSGASWNFTGRPVAEQFTTGTASGLPLLDKPYMTVDNHTGSPFQDRIYVTYTLFGTDGTGRIYEAFSNDYGESFSTPVQVFGSSTLCPFGATGPGQCDASQFSQPFTGPDGALYVIADNYNNGLTSATDNHNQVLLAKSTDGGATFSAPVLVANFNDLPDCDTYQGVGQNPFRACVPEKGNSFKSVFRAANYPSGTATWSMVSVTFGSYISADSNEANGCIPNGLAADFNNAFIGVKTPGACNNKILLSVSTDGGAGFTGGTTDVRKLPSVSGHTKTDQWWQWAAVTGSGKLTVSYYDRQYGNDETNGYMDISLSLLEGPWDLDTRRVTSSSMPPPTQFPNAQGNSVFFGDYSGLSVAAGIAHPFWMDTRDRDLFLCPGTGAPGIPPAVCAGIEPNGLTANSQDVFSRSEPLPQ
ncbi:MAG TPA: sialidase family protein [Steroidobacteraceae bacterium]|jgi:hypothetical protein|nr:sialidase family protein [Steroidobacteraceae bacterium]